MSSALANGVSSRPGRSTSISSGNVGASVGGRRSRTVSLSNGGGPLLDNDSSLLQDQHDGTDTDVDLSALFDNAASLADVRNTLGRLHDRETALTGRLQTLVSGHADLNRDLLRLDSLRAALGTQVIETRGISNTMLAGAADTAGRLSSTVRNLDLEKAHVAATLRVVEQVAELKACVAGVVGSMGAPQDWEAAAGYLARASRIPDSIVSSGFASAVVPTVEVPDPPAVTLEEARQSLCGLFLREFERAAQSSDDARVTRFFKLFPLIGRTDVGLDVYGRYVCQGVAASARTTFKDVANPSNRKDGSFFYANALTKLFTHISQIVEGHGALVERHYGTGQMVKVIDRLQKEADVQGGIIVDAWSDERGVDRKLTDVKSYPFSFLVQSFLAQRGGGGIGGGGGGMGSGGHGTPRVNSPALGLDGDAANSPRRSEDEGGVNMKEVDGLLSEIAVMLGRWSLYSRFLGAKCRDPSADADAPLSMPPVITQSNLQRKVSARLITPYNLMATFFFRRSVEKAFQLEEMPSDLSLNMNRPVDNNPPYIISAVDDVMYIANAVVQKCMSTLQRDVVVGVIPPVSRVLGSDFIGMVQRKMRDECYPRALVQGGFPPEDRIISFIVLINSLDMADEYLARIVSNRMGVPADDVTSRSGSSGHNVSQLVPSPAAPAVLAHLTESFPFEHDATAVANALATLHHSFTVTAGELLGEGLQVLFNQVVKARLRPVLADTFRDVDYSLSELDLADIVEQQPEEYEGLDQLLEMVPRRFEIGWDALMRPLGRLLTPRTMSSLSDLTAKYLSRVLEKRVWGYTGRACAYGAIRLERDINGIISIVARGNYGAREMFAKTTQILMVANMEDDEWEELGGVDINGGGGANGGGDDGDEDEDDGMVWLLSEDERRKARNMVRPTM